MPEFCTSVLSGFLGQGQITMTALVLHSRRRVVARQASLSELPGAGLAFFCKWVH
jgi:hypothetical protein